jgi:hypothetical protein
MNFLRLSEVEQYDAVWSLGVHEIRISKIILPLTCYSLIFYCEVYYDMKTNKILYKQTSNKGLG